MAQAPPPFEKLLAQLLAELGAFDIKVSQSGSNSGRDYRIMGPARRTMHLHVFTYQRLTPATADAVFRRLRDESQQAKAEPVLYASVVSDRTAKIAKEYEVSLVDFAGNCHLVFPEFGIYVSRSGVRNPFGKTMSGRLNVFSPKSSRVVRVMLHEPSRGWRLGELAEHRDVRISGGLMSRIKKSMIDEGYAVMHDRQLFLKRSEALLQDWVQHYRTDKPKENGFYVRGDVEAVESKLAAWFAHAKIEHALSHFSAAWRLAPEVRYSISSFLVSAEALQADTLASLREACGVRRVDSGANLILRIPKDKSHFSGRLAEPLETTSHLQTYLDLMTLEGRGEEAAMAIYDEHLGPSLESADHAARSLE
ncbi:hypothetical protein CA13_18950 [Planctomycetes bacterium CA13]|uniref:Uncharacterized protein n=1 Tax=Novipirellula herctigrandis TaxID=2527986 RepID=A0A5C5Z0E0_9BACT|nr:hypothetical protein CA13_18950 [Planctomycetes bacterium CA13]